MINWNLRKKIQNLISGQKKGDGLDRESGYRDLTPESDTKNSEEYIRALHWAIKNKDVKNIALSGPYGSGMVLHLCRVLLTHQKNLHMG